MSISKHFKTSSCASLKNLKVHIKSEIQVAPPHKLLTLLLNVLTMACITIDFVWNYVDTLKHHIIYYIALQSPIANLQRNFWDIRIVQSFSKTDFAVIFMLYEYQGKYEMLTSWLLLNLSALNLSWYYLRYVTLFWFELFFQSEFSNSPTAYFAIMSF